MARELGERLGYRPALDGLRGVAVLLVVVYHIDQAMFAQRFHLAGGFLGVDLFFVLSGFLITRLLIEEHQRSGSVDLRAFYRRRAVRLLPALDVMLAVVLVLAGMWSSRFGAAQPRATLVSFFYVANWAVAWHGWGELGVLAPLWSLAVEEQFYVLWPLVFVALTRRQRVAAFCAVATLTSASCTIAGSWAGVDVMRLYNATPTHGAILLLGGSFMAATLRLPTPLSVRAADALGIVCAAALAAMVVTTSAFERIHYATGFVPVLGVCLGLLVAALTAGSLTARLLSVRALRRIGALSYGIYLWHVPMITAVGVLPGRRAFHVPVAILGAIVLAWLSSITVERWAQRFRTPKSPRPEAGAVIDLTAATATSTLP